MKLVLMMTCCLAAVAPLRAVADIIAIQPTITFYEDGTAPAATGAVTVGGTFTVRYVGTAAAKGVDSAYVSGDSLILMTYRDSLIYVANAGSYIMPPYFSGPELTFMRAGVLQVYELPAGGALKRVAVLRVLPLVETVPVLPVTGQPVRLAVTLGLSHSACNPSYTDTVARAGDSTVALSWTEVPFSGACPAVYYDPPLAYGPSFNAGTLTAGTYTVLIDDSVAAGTFTVEDPVSVDGVVYEMKHPLTDMLDQPVESVKVVASTYYPCSWYYVAGYDGPVCSTYTDDRGMYTLELPRADLKYTFTAKVEGFHEQSLVYDQSASGLHVFQVLPEADTAFVPVRMMVQDGDGAPLESVYVSMYGGREPVICAVYDARAAALVSLSGGMTGADGIARFDSVALVPFIDYVYTAQRFGADGFTQKGVCRLFRAPGYDNDVLITVGVAGVDEPRMDNGARLYVDISGNPVTGGMLDVRYAAGAPATFSLFDRAGALVRSADGDRSGTMHLGLEGLPGGVYLLQVRAGEQLQVVKVMVR